MSVEEDELIVMIRRHLRDIITAFVHKHVIAFVYKGIDRDQHDIGSGFIARVKGQEVLVTAGHLCKDIVGLAKTKQLKSLRLCYLCGPRDVEWYTLLPSESAHLPAEWDRSDDCVDVGIVRCPNRFLYRTAELGIERIDESKFRRTNESIAQRVAMVAGVSAVDSYEHIKNRLYLVSNGEVVDYQNRDVQSLGFRTVPLTQLDERSPSLIDAIPFGDDEKSIRGMSGGPVVEFYHKPDSKLDDFVVIGVQSSQGTIDDIVQTIRFVPATKVLNVVKELISRIESST